STGVGAPTDASYVTATTESGLSAERVLTAGKGIGTIADGGSTITVPVDETVADVRFGGDGQRAIPTSGTLTGEYWQSGNYATSGTITCNRCRLHVAGTVDINHAITVNTELSGGIGSDGNGSVPQIGASYGQGLG